MRTHARLRRLALVAGFASLAVVGCGDTASSPVIDDPTSPPTSVPTSTPGSVPGSTTPTTDGPSADRGWIGGEPDWDSGGSDDGLAAPSAADVEVETGAPGSATSEYERELPSPVMPGEPGQPLRAGSVDDNADLAGYLDYLDRVESLGIPIRPFDPTGRIVVTVRGANGLPVAGQVVSISPVDPATGGASTDAPIIELRTSADGQVILLPAEHADGAYAGSPSFSFSVGADGIVAEAGSAAELAVASDGGRGPGLAVDVLFLLDATGSMGDEIAQLKATVADVAAELAVLPQQPDIRFAMTLYRDEGDAFVTSTFDFTGDVAAFQAALSDVIADGGGDTPEALDEAFAAALGEPSWRDPASTVQLVFLVADAAPQVGRQVDQPYTESIIGATERGITVHAIAASSTDDSAEVAFRHIAQGTGGRFVFLTYGAGGAATGPATDIGSTDYEELSLDDLVVRLVGEELAALTGESFTDPTPSTVPPTNPPGQ